MPTTARKTTPRPPGRTRARLWSALQHRAIHGTVVVNRAAIAQHLGVGTTSVKYNLQKLVELQALEQISRNAYRINVNKSEILFRRDTLSVCSKRRLARPTVQECAQTRRYHTNNHTHLHGKAPAPARSRARMHGGASEKIEENQRSSCDVDSKRGCSPGPAGPACARNFTSTQTLSSSPPTGEKKNRSTSRTPCSFFSPTDVSDSAHLHGNKDIESWDPRLRKLLERLVQSDNKKYYGFQRSRSCVPPFPGNELIKPPKIPPPALLDRDRKPEDWFRQIARVWISVVKAYFGQGVSSWEFRDIFPRREHRKDPTNPHRKIARFVPPKPPQKTRHWKLVTQFATALIEHEIPPGAWIAFRFDVWSESLADRLDFTQQGAVPPVSWVMRPASVTKHLSWYLQEEERYTIRPTLTCQLHKKLITDWQLMHLDLQALPLDAPPDAARRVVQRHFPNNSFSDRVTAARREAREVQKRIYDRAEMGEFVWTIR